MFAIPLMWFIQCISTDWLRPLSYIPKRSYQRLEGFTSPIYVMKITALVIIWTLLHWKKYKAHYYLHIDQTEKATYNHFTLLRQRIAQFFENFATLRK